jgi:hypothetical protein
MMPTWNDLTSGPRWRGVVGFIRNWVGPLDAAHGMLPAEFAEALQSVPLDLPAAVREWCLLAGNWRQGGANVWIRPHALTIRDGAVCVFTDTQGTVRWGIRVADLQIEDPHIISLDGDPNEIDFPTFTSFVAAMIVNDVIFFDDETGGSVELNPASVHIELTCLLSARCGAYYADAALESANVVAFAYPGNGPAFGKARVSAGSALLERLRLRTA